MSQLVDLKVGFTCNNNCIHCVVSDKINEPDLTLSEIKNLISDFISEYETISLTLTGGEITYREDFLEIMDFVKSLKINNFIDFVDMQTNGRMLANEYQLKAALDVVDFFLIALHSSIPEIHDAITQSTNSFNETTMAISKLCNSKGPDCIAIQTVINKNNISTLSNVYEFIFSRFGIKEFNITFPHPIGIAQSKDVIPTYKEAQPFINSTLQYCLSVGIYPFIEAIPFCVFEPSLREYAIEFHKKRDISVVGFAGEKDQKVDYKAVFAEGHAKYDSCSFCRYNFMCDGVWKEHKELFPDEDMFSLMKERG